jgi:FHS family L-fucose permease-like MFS transporter
MLAQFAFFMAYFVVSLPAAGIIARLGNTKSILVALAIMIAGCLTMPLATKNDSFAVVLVGLFVIAGGITILQVVANPLAAALGKPEGSHFRLTFSQAFNSFGTWLAPMVVSSLLLVGGIFAEGAKCESVTPQMRADSMAKIDLTFLLMAGALVLLAIFIWAFRRKLDVATDPMTAADRPSVMTALKSKWAVLGGVAIFMYVGAEVSIGSAMTNFLNYEDMLGVSLRDAGHMVAYYWGGAMIGRFVGSFLLTKIPATRLLAIFAAIAAVMCLAVSQLHGTTASYIALSIGLFNSIMFPVIFTLTLERSTASASATSGLLCLSIVGGAVLPYLFGLIADAVGGPQPALSECVGGPNTASSAGLHAAYLLPMAAYAVISIFAVRAGKAAIVTKSVATSGGGH